jgi:hypothetical protein
MKTIERSKLPDFIRSQMGKLTVKQYAAHLGVTPPCIYDLLSGLRKPDDKTAAKLGLRSIYEVLR